MLSKAGVRTRRRPHRVQLRTGEQTLGFLHLRVEQAEVTDPMLPTKLTLRDTGSACIIGVTTVLHCIHCTHMPRCSFLATDVAEEFRGQK